ncbi:MAG: hypothetical protein LBU35_00950 [Holosporales bacterium]|jgi:hypothetical protein|nr:hypothetical protein [Holosporales bacterium]
MKKICLGLMGAVMLSTCSFAGILGEGVDKSLAQDSFSIVSGKMSEARSYIMNNTNFSNGFGDLWGAADELSKIVEPNSEQARRLNELKASIDARGFSDSSDPATIEEARMFFEDAQRTIDEVMEDIRKETDMPTDFGASGGTGTAGMSPAVEEGGVTTPPVDLNVAEPPVPEAGSSSPTVPADAPAPITEEASTVS